MGKNAIKILHIDSERGWRGGQQQVAYLVAGLQRYEFQTTLICQPKSELGAYFQNNGLPYYAVRMLNEADFIAGLKIAAFCRRKGFQIIHCHSSHSLAIGLWTKLFYPPVKLIAVRRVDFHVNRNWFSRFKYLNPRLDRIVCISNAIKKVLSSDGLADEKLVTIHSGIDIHKFDHIPKNGTLRQRLGIPQSHVVVGAIGAMVGHKDYPNLLNAAKIVLQRVPNVTFCAVGDGPDQRKILSLARDLGIEQQFIFTGFQKDVGVYLKMFDIFVLASHLEGLGTSLLDAQAAGLPVVGAISGGIPEVVLDGETGYLVARRDSVALAQAILKLIQTPKLRRQLGSAAKAHSKNFDIEITVRKNIDLYQEILK